MTTSDSDNVNSFEIGSGKDWCLMCELEQHVMMLRESGGPLSASRILSQMRSINCQIGDGSQEDAHEFLRFFFLVLFRCDFVNPLFLMRFQHFNFDFSYPFYLDAGF